MHSKSALCEVRLCSAATNQHRPLTCRPIVAHGDNHRRSIPLGLVELLPLIVLKREFESTAELIIAVSVGNDAFRTCVFDLKIALPT